MKKTLLIAGIMTSFIATSTFAQKVFVGSDPEPRNVILEEFSGIYCGYCPDGAIRAQAIIDAFPGRVAMVKIHSSNTYSAPQIAAHPDFRTQHGPAIATFSGLRGYPNGMVNRVVYGSNTSLAMGRGEWMNAAADIINSGDNSPVNIGIKTEWDEASREITITVQTYYTDNSQAEQSNMLNVVAIEDGIIGYQSGPGGGNDYEHNETVRSFITGADGDEIDATTVGNLNQRIYTYTVDADYNIDNMRIVAYVTEENKENAFTAVWIDAKGAVGHSGNFEAAPSAANTAVGINETSTFTGVSVFPNPTNQVAYVNVATNVNANVNVDVYNVIGELVANPFNGVVTSGVANKIELNTESWNNGIYFVTVRSGEAVRTVKLNVAH